MKKIKNIVILAAGDSARLWPLSDKNRTVFLGKPLIEYQLERFSSHAEQIIIIVNKHSFDDVSRIASKYDVQVVVQEGKGQAAAILSAGPMERDALLVNCSDLFEDFFYDRLWVEIDSIIGDGLFGAIELKEYFPGGILRVEGRRVLEVIEKPGKDAMPSNFMKVFVDYFKDASKLIQVIRKTKTDRDDWYEKSVSAFIHSGAVIEFFKYDGVWTTLKYPWHVLSMNHFFLNKITSHTGKNAVIDKTAIIEGDVYFEDNVKVLEYAKVVGPSYIGNNTVVGNYALVVNSMIGENCVIGGYSEVSRSYLGNNVWLHRNYLGDSVLENNILFGAGALAANFRFDEKNVLSTVKGERIDTNLHKLGALVGSNVKVGVNASLMPGVKIAAGERVNPGIVVKKDVHA